MKTLELTLSEDKTQITFDFCAVKLHVHFAQNSFEVCKQISENGKQCPLVLVMSQFDEAAKTHSFCGVPLLGVFSAGGRSPCVWNGLPSLALHPGAEVSPRLEHLPREKARRLVLQGLGCVKETKLSTGVLACSAGEAPSASLAKSLDNKKFYSQNLEDFFEPLMSGLYSFLNWDVASKSDNTMSASKLEKSNKGALEELHCVIPVPFDISNEEWVTEVKEALFCGFAQQRARYLGDLPSNFKTPKYLAEQAWLSEVGFEGKLFDFDELKRQGFGGIVAVGKGSASKPFVYVGEWSHPKAKKCLVLVGKGVTFDTGGYSIKPKQNHNEMKYDMCGAANVVAACEVLARQGVPLKIVCLLACAENMVGEQAQRPGDVYQAWNGKTVDVYNTDAEGRLMLADLLSFAGTFAPDCIVDMATLTGGTVSIAGKLAAIITGNKNNLVHQYQKCALDVGERYLQLEMVPGAIEDMKGAASDYTNMNAKWSSGCPTLYSAAFLEAFVPCNVPWIHLDIANMAWGLQNFGMYSGAGANAFGARSLAGFAREWSES
jgi:leucyl aminopeptidase